jgi:hypothetical protein
MVVQSKNQKGLKEIKLPVLQTDLIATINEKEGDTLSPFFSILEDEDYLK